MMLIDDILPDYQIKRTYWTVIRAPKEAVFDAMLHDVHVTDSLVVRTLVRMRELPLKLFNKGNEIFPKDPVTFYEFLKRSPFTLLGRKENEEIVLGVVGRFWNIIDIRMKKMQGPDQFKAFCDDGSGYGKAVMNFFLESFGDRTRLSTETRVYFSAAYMQRFRNYWFFVEPFSGLMRKIFLWNIKRAVEKQGASCSHSRHRTP